MKKFLLIVPVAAALTLSACNMNQEVEPDIRLEESPSVGINDTSEESVMREDESDENSNEDRRMTATPSPSGVMMEDDENTLRIEGGVDTGR